MLLGNVNTEALCVTISLNNVNWHTEEHFYYTSRFPRAIGEVEGTNLRSRLFKYGFFLVFLSMSVYSNIYIYPPVVQCNKIRLIG